MTRRGFRSVPRRGGGGELQPGGQQSQGRRKVPAGPSAEDGPGSHGKETGKDCPPGWTKGPTLSSPVGRSLQNKSLKSLVQASG